MTILSAISFSRYRQRICRFIHNEYSEIHYMFLFLSNLVKLLSQWWSKRFFYCQDLKSSKKKKKPKDIIVAYIYIGPKDTISSYFYQRLTTLHYNFGNKKICEVPLWGHITNPSSIWCLRCDAKISLFVCRDLWKNKS